MRFAKKIKTLNTFKSNNTGVNVADIGNTLRLNNNAFSEESPMFISMHFPHNPFIEKKKTLFNTSHLLSLNNQISLNSSFFLSTQCNIGISELKNEIWETQNYFLNEKQQLKIISNTNGLLKQWHIAPVVRLEANTEQVYFSNVLSSDIVHKHTDVAIWGSYPNQEHGNINYFKLKNDFSSLFKWGKKDKKVIGVKSINSWSKRPQHLKIQKDSIGIDETITSSVFYSNTSVSQSFAIGKGSLSVDEGCTFARETLQTTLKGIVPQVFNNHFEYNKILLYINPSYVFSMRSLKFSCALPVNYNINSYTNRWEAINYSKNKYLLSPSTRVQWTINNKYKWSVSGTWEALPESSHHFHAQPLLSSYPYLQTGLTDFQHQINTKISTRLYYKNILRGLFWHVFYSKIWQYGDVIPTRSFDDIYILYSMIRHPHNTQQDLLSTNISYMPNLINGEISLQALYLLSDAYLLQNQIIEHSHSAFTRLTFKLSSEISRYFMLDYTCNYMRSKYKIAQNKDQSNYNISQQLRLTVSPHKKINIALEAYHYNNHLDRQIYNPYLLDANLNYSHSSKWRFKISAQNILNQKTFIYKYYTAMTAIEQQYNLRPFSLLLSVSTFL